MFICISPCLQDIMITLITGRWYMYVTYLNSFYIYFPANTFQIFSRR